jgi:hypothetical protein
MHGLLVERIANRRVLSNLPTMPLNPLAPLTDYQSMLNRIFWFTSASALAAIWLLRAHIPGVEVVLSHLDVAAPWKADSLQPTRGGFVLPALAVGIASRVFRLHSRISDWLGIREHFDVHVIIRELAARTEVDFQRIGEARLRDERHKLMRKGFYAFVSGGKSEVDPQLIQQALDAWSWFWIGVEATLIFTLTGLGLNTSGAYRIGFQTLGAALAFAVFGLPALRKQCARYAVAQVREIVSDPLRKAAVRAAFDELTTGGASIRVAA